MGDSVSEENDSFGEIEMSMVTLKRRTTMVPNITNTLVAKAAVASVFNPLAPPHKPIQERRKLTTVYMEEVEEDIIGQSRT